MTYMSFQVYKDYTFHEAVTDYKYDVRINPETFDRSISVRAIQPETIENKGSTKFAAGAESESYSFDLLFDGTGVISSIPSAAALKKEFDQFLSVVFRKPESDPAGGQTSPGTSDSGKSNNGNPAKKTKPPVNYVRISYCGQHFDTQLDSLSIKYLLFNKEGDPLRIKVSCRFSSAEEPSSTNQTDSSGATVSSAPAVSPDSQNSECVHTEDSFEKTVSSAIQNDSISLLACCYTMEEMMPLIFSPSNYTPVEGYDV